MRQRVPTTIGSIKGSGITVRLCTGDHLETAVSIAERCGIYTGVPGLLHSALSCIQVGAKLGQNDRIARWLQVLARASPEDKARLVASLRDRNRIVAFLGDGINDRLALEEANISFSMAVEGTEVAKQASDIALMNNNLDSVLNVLRWGRCILDCRQSFIDLYIPMGLTLLSITSVSAVLSSTAKPALSLVQLVWITFLINPLAALALSTSRPSESGIEGDAAPRPPAIQSGVHYSVVQVSLVLSFFFGHVLLGHPLAESVADISARTRTQIFNTVAFMQIFRTLTIRKLDRTSVMANGLFAIILAAGSFNTFLLHLLIVLAGGSMFDVTPMNGYEWTSSIVLAVIVILVTSLYKRWTLYAQRIEEELPTAEWGEQGH
jgi:Ca2+-transporting ATPase